MLRVDHLKVRGLPSLSFAVSAGECLAIEGPSGSGKTLILRAIADLDPCDGTVFLEGAERGEMSAREWRRQVRYVAAETAWWADTPRQHIPASVRLERLMAAMALDGALLDRELSRLSTGERQRLALVRALADEPKVLLLDEPASALDAAAAGLVDELIRLQLLAGRAVILVSHDPVQIERLAHLRLQLGAMPAPREPEPGSALPGAPPPGAPPSGPGGAEMRPSAGARASHAGMMPASPTDAAIAARGMVRP